MVTMATENATSMVAKSQEQLIQNVVTSNAHHLDQRQWAELRALYTDVVTYDFRSLLGGDVQDVPADDMIASWLEIHSTIDATQHLIGAVAIVIETDHATADCHVRAYHRKNGAAGGEEWMVAGHYTYELIRLEATWKIRKVRLDLLYQTGNTALLTNH